MKCTVDQVETPEAQTKDTLVTQDTLVTLDTLEIVELADHQCVEPHHAHQQQQPFQCVEPHHARQLLVLTESTKVQTVSF